MQRKRPPEPTPPPASPIARIGLLTVVIGAAAAVAALLHLAFFPGAAYTWTRPARLLWTVASGAYFPVFSLAVFALGFVSRADRVELRGVDEHLRSLWRGSSQGHRIAKAIGLALGGAALAFLTCPDYQLADLAAIALFGLYLGLRRPARRDWARFFGELLLVVLLFSLVSYAFTVVKALLFRHGEPHDQAIIAMETALFGLAPHRALAQFAAGHPWALWLADQVYYLLFQHMFFVSVVLVGAARRQERIEYLGALALCYVGGAFAYHLFPVLGPAFFDEPTFARLRDWPTITDYFQGLLFRNTALASAGEAPELQTYEYIAGMPSLHMAHELVMLWYSRRSRGFFALSLGFTLLTSVAIVLLGWHYPTDALAGALLAAGAVALAHRYRGVLLPAALMQPGPEAKPGA